MNKADNFDLVPYRVDKLYPNKAAFKTGKSKLDMQMDRANQESKLSPGISFYCRKRDEYLFIPSNKR